MKLRNPTLTLSNPLWWGVFILYIFLSGYSIFYHELWGDELHSWNIAKASISFSDLVSNTRYEGHPPLWYSMLWIISKFTHDVTVIQWLQLIIAMSIAFIILFLSPFSFLTRLLIPFGYFFLYEYAVFSRNYAIGFLCAFCICLILQKDFKNRTLLYYIFLFLLANTHLLALVLAAGFHIYFLLSFPEKKKKIVFHVIVGLLVLAPSAWFIFPPADSSLSADFWLQRWNADQLSSIVKSPLRAFLPIPAWWNYHSWNTEFLVEAQMKWSFLKWIIGLLSIIILFFTIMIFKKDKRVLFFYLSILMMIFFLSIVIPFSNARQVGFIFVSFLLAYWLFCYRNTVNRFQNNILLVLLFVQLIAGIFSVIKEIKYPFSNGNNVKALINKIPAGNKWVTDYWCLNNISAYLDTSAYCIDLQQEKTFLQWNREMKEMLQNPNRYYTGMNSFFREKKIESIYLVTIHSPQDIGRIDSLFFSSYRLDVIDSYEGAIEKSGNLYLYRIGMQ